MNITHDESPGKGMSSPQQQPFHSPHEPPIQITSPKPTPPYSTSNSNSAIPVLSSGTKHTSSYSNGHANINHPNNPKPITIEELRKFFHLPIAEVAKHFGTCTTALKKLCRKLHIHKWPYRQILSLSKSIQSLEYAAKCDGVSNETRAQFRSQISILEQMIAEVVQDPSKAMEALNKELEASVANGDGGAEKNEDIQNLIIAATAALSKSVNNNNNNPTNKNATNNNNISTINSSSDDNHHYTQSVQKAVVSSSSGMPLPSSHYQPSTQLHQSFQLSQNTSQQQQQQQQQLHHSQPPPQQQLSQNWSSSSTGKKQQLQQQSHQPQQQQLQHQQYKSGLKRSNDSFDDNDHHLPYTNNILALNSNNNNNINNSNNNNSHNQQLDERIHKKGKVHGDHQAGNGHGQGSPRFNGYDDRALTLSPSDLMKLKEVDVGLTTVQSIYNHAGNKYHFTGQVLLAPLHRKKFRPNTNRKIIPLMEPDIGNSFSVDFFPNIIMGPK
jgi:hypothetical protein